MEELLKKALKEKIKEQFIIDTMNQLERLKYMPLNENTADILREVRENVKAVTASTF